MSRLRKIMSQSVHNIGYLQRPDRSWTVSSEESLGLLMDTHFPDSSESPTIVHARGDGVEEECPLVDQMTASNIHWALGSFKPFKSPGPDGIFPAQLQHSCWEHNKLANDHV